VRAAWRGIAAGGARRDFRVWRWVNLVEWAHRTGADFS